MHEPVEPDLISGVLATFGFRAEVFSSPTVCGPWRISTTGLHRATFHLVSRGACWLHMRDRVPQALRSGDLVVFPSDAWQVLTEEPMLLGDDILPGDATGPMTSLVCGRFEFAYGYDNPILALLPDCILIQADAGGSRLGAIVQLLSDDYLTAWRMKLAERMLVSERLGVDEIAQRLGYEPRRRSGALSSG